LLDVWKGNVKELENGSGKKASMFAEEKIVKGGEVDGLVIVKDWTIEKVHFLVEPDFV
jgi:hypothetical protein